LKSWGRIDLTVNFPLFLFWVKDLPEQFVGKEELTEATTEFLKKIGVAKVGHRPIVEVTKEKEEVKICSLTEVRYHYPDGKIEPQIGVFFCAKIPKELWNEVRELLKTITL